MSIFLRPIGYNLHLERELQKEVYNCMHDVFIKPIKQSYGKKRHNNSTTILIDAIKSGEVIYDNGIFSGNITEELAKEIRGLGGVYNASTNSYIIAKSKVPEYIVKTSFELNKRREEALKRLYSMLNNIESSNIIDNYSFEDIFKKIVKNTADKVQKSLAPIPKQHRNIGIFHTFNEEQKANIAKQYSENMKLYIKNFTIEQTNIVRKEVQESIVQGKLPRSIEKFLIERFEITKNKAKFLAKQETALCTVAQKKELYRSQGIKKMKWKATQDSKTRLLHKELHNTIFDVDNLPIIDARTGQTGYPGEAYGCRCTFSPVIEL